MHRRTRSGGGGGESGIMRWLLTYADMITLLMALFIVLFALAQVEPGRRAELAAVFESIFQRKSGNAPLGAEGPAPPPPGAPFLPVLVPAREGDPGALTLEQVAERVRAWVRAQGLEGNVEVVVTGRGLIIRLNDRLLFDLGRAELKPEARKLLDRLVPLFKELPNEIIAEGHTDNLPISTPQFPSNWELSAARAVAVVRYLESLGIPPERLGAVGYGEWRPLVPNDSPENRQRNRRVELVIVAPPSQRFTSGGRSP